MIIIAGLIVFMVVFYIIAISIVEYIIKKKNQNKIKSNLEKSELNQYKYLHNKMYNKK